MALKYEKKKKYRNYSAVPGAEVLVAETSVAVGSQILSKKFKFKSKYLAATRARIDYLPTS